MDLASRRAAWTVQRDTLRFLEALAGRRDHSATTDDAVGDLAGEYADGGKWRGSIPLGLARAGLIASAGVRVSDRASRHRGLVRVWRAMDLAGIERRRDELRRWLADHPEPAEPVSASLFGDLGEGTVDHAR
jgi:hypothetical protein